MLASQLWQRAVAPNDWHCGPPMIRCLQISGSRCVSPSDASIKVQLLACLRRELVLACTSELRSGCGPELLVSPATGGVHGAMAGPSTRSLAAPLSLAR